MDGETSGTMPTTSAAQANISATCTTSIFRREPSNLGFLGLPRELRDMIYELALVNNNGIEYNTGRCHGIGSCYNNRLQDHVRASRRGEYCVCGHCPSLNFGQVLHRITGLSILRVCKAFYLEAAEIFYGQHFQFSGTFGWLALYHWLIHIGPSNRNLLKNITVEHPASSVNPFGPWVCDGRNLRKLYKQHIKPLGLRAHEFDPETFYSKHKDLTWGKRQHGTRGVPHAGYLLNRIAGLRSLQLTYPVPDFLYFGPTYEPLETHPIHAFFESKNGLELNLVKREWPAITASTVALSEDEAQFRAIVQSQGWKIIYEQCEGPGKPGETAE